MSITGEGDAQDNEEDFDGALLPEDSQNVMQCLQELKKVDNDQEEVRTTTNNILCNIWHFTLKL